MSPQFRLKIRDVAKCLLDFPQYGSWQGFQGSDKPPIVDRAGLVDHDLLLQFLRKGRPCRQGCLPERLPQTVEIRRVAA